jgi:hypothetical protein
MPAVGTARAAPVVAGDLPADREEPRAKKAAILVVGEAAIHHEEDFLCSVLCVGSRHAEATQRSPHEIGVKRKELSDPVGGGRPKIRGLDGGRRAWLVELNRGSCVFVLHARRRPS